MAQVVVTGTLLVLAAWYAAAQLDCATLNVERSISSPLSGSRLSFCSTPSEQCCTQDYIDKVRREVAEELLGKLRDEVRVNVRLLSDITDILGGYFERDFLSSIRNGLPLTSFYQDHVADATAALARFLSRSKFVINASNPEVNTTQIILSMLDGIKSVLEGTSLPDSAKTCLINGITNSVNYEIVRVLGNDLKEVRRAFTLLVEIWKFSNNFASSFKAFVVKNIPETCLNRAIEIYFCGRCTAVLPPMCSNTCGALVRGCYAAFVTGLQSQFNHLWNVTRQAVNVLKTGVTNILESQMSFVNITQVKALPGQCAPTNPFGKRQTSTFPSQVDTLARTIRGIFVYGPSGPGFCVSDTSELRYCNGSGRAPSDRSCSSDEICTSPCLCWNGQSRSNNDTAVFTGTTVEEQGANPVLKVPKEEYEAVISEIGTPVNTFLNSDSVQAILPQNVSVVEGGASATMAVSMATLIGMALFQLLLVY